MGLAGSIPMTNRGGSESGLWLSCHFINPPASSLFLRYHFIHVI